MEFNLSDKNLDPKKHSIISSFQIEPTNPSENIQNTADVSRNKAADDEMPKTILTQIIEDYGYKWEVWKIIISVFICFILNGYLTTSFCSYVLGYTKKFNLSSNQISFLGTCFFITKFLSSFSMGYLTHFFSRLTLIRIALVTTFLINFMNGFFLNYIFLVFIQSINGVLSGIFEIASFNLACEFIPIRFRGWVMLSIWNGYNFGVLMPNLVMLYFMPNHEPEGLRPTIMSCAFIVFFISLVTLLFIKDSPRNNIINGKFEDAFKVLKKMKSHDPNFFTEDIKKKIIGEITLENLESDVGELEALRNMSMKSMKEIFANGMMWTGILLIIICFFGNVINDGFQLVLNLLLDKLKSNNHSQNGLSVLKENILINTIDLPSNLLLGIFTEFKILGRRNTQAAGFFLLAVFIFPVIFAPGKAYIFLIFFMFFTSITNMVNVYVSEIYPTKTRDLALGVIQAVGYFGSCISQYAFVYLNELNFYICPVAFLILCTVNGILSLNLKVDTYGMALDSGKVETKKKSEKKTYEKMVELSNELDNDKQSRSGTVGTSMSSSDEVLDKD